VASDGTPNACSALYRAVVRVAREMGYKRVQTFTLGRENGASLNAAGFTKDRTSPGGSWNGPKRPRTDKHPTDPKTLWVIDLRPQAHSD